MARAISKTSKKAKEESISSSEEESVTEYSDNQLEEAEENLEDVEITESIESNDEESVIGEISSEENENSQEESTASGSEQEEDDDETQRTIFIKDLDYDVREDDIKKQMIRLGNVIRVTVPMSHDQRRNKGFAYVEFKTVDEAKKALKLDGTELLGRKVMVCQAKPKSNKNIYTVFCKNLSYNTTKEELKEHFEKYGKVFNISLPIDSENKERNKGFCFVEYTDRDVVDKVLKAKHIVNERQLYLNEGNKNEDRNSKRSNDRLYGRKEDRNDNRNDKRGGFKRENNFGEKKFNDRRDGERNDRREGRFNNRRDGDRNDRNDRRENGFKKRNDFDRKQDRNKNKKVFDDSD